MPDLPVWPAVGPPTRVAHANQGDTSVGRRWGAGQLVMDTEGTVWKCIVGGEPGTWEALTPAGGGGSGASVQINTLVVNVKDHGALGDGATDDTAAIQAAVNSLPAGGGVVYFPAVATYYKVTTAITAGSGVEFLGTGYASRIHSTNTTRTDVFQATGLVGTHLTGLAVRMLRITATSTAIAGATTGNGVNWTYVDDSEVANCWFDGHSDSAVVVQFGHRNRVVRNHASRCAQGITVFYASNGNTVANNTINDIHTYVGIDVEGTVGNGRPVGTVVTNNVVNGAITAGIDVVLANDTTVTANSITAAGTQGIRSFGGYRPSITGNVCFANGAYGIQIGADTQDASVVSNVTHGNTSGGFRATDESTQAVTNLVLKANRWAEGDPVFVGNVSLAQGETVLVPASACLYPGAAASTWFEANAALMHRFTLDEAAQFRYYCLNIDTASGNVEFAVVRLSGGSHLTFTRVKTSGKIACPAAADLRYDLGVFTLPPGEYGLAFWADNTTVKVWHSFNNSVPKRSMIYVPDTGSAGIGASGAGAVTTRFVSGLHLEANV